MIPDGFQRVTGRLPWGQLPALVSDAAPLSFVYQGFQGWVDDRWYDGPSFVLVQGVVTSYVLPPGRGPLVFDRAGDSQVGLEAWIAAREFFAWKKSLGEAFRQRLGLTEAAYVIEGRPENAADALVLLGLRIAFPHTIFYLFDFPSDGKPPWKRLAQNLNISTWASPAQIRERPALVLSELSAAWPLAAAQRFWAQFKVPVLPGKLAQLFNQPITHP